MFLTIFLRSFTPALQSSSELLCHIVSHTLSTSIFTSWVAPLFLNPLTEAQTHSCPLSFNGDFKDWPLFKDCAAGKTENKKKSTFGFLRDGVGTIQFRWRVNTNTMQIKSNEGHWCVLNLSEGERKNTRQTKSNKREIKTGRRREGRCSTNACPAPPPRFYKSRCYIAAKKTTPCRHRTRNVYDCAWK